ncbi:hypothetical protein [Streptomyces sp. NPDC058335]|uniref:hypothetical protein n=1 Tax=Streptomyces sp. NPDC058335 TaxID=3346451 RepID=UPI00365D961D
MEVPHRDGLAGRARAVRPWATLHIRFRRWAADGTFERMLKAAQAQADAVGDVGWLVSVDSTIVRAHQHAARARRGGFASPASDAPDAA